MLEPLCRPLYAWGRVKGAEPRQESKAKRVSNVFCHPSLVHFLTLLFPSLFATKSKQAPPLSKASPAYPLRLGTRRRSQNKVRSSSKTRSPACTIRSPTLLFVCFFFHCPPATRRPCCRLARILSTLANASAVHQRAS